MLGATKQARPKPQIRGPWRGPLYDGTPLPVWRPASPHLLDGLVAPSGSCPARRPPAGPGEASRQNAALTRSARTCRLVRMPGPCRLGGAWPFRGDRR
eukprot:scaffold5472_cov391-Prasinococcus_capsulatus_cf.AAC.6